MKKVHIVGNVLNLGLLFGETLRSKGYDVRIFMDGKSTPFYQPSWEDPRLTRLPDWVETVDVNFSRMFLGRKERSFVSQLQDCDVIQTFGEYSIWAWQTKTPYHVLSYGGDLEIMPFLPTNLKTRALAVLIKKAFKKANSFVYAIPSHRRLVEKLGLGNAVFNPYAVPIDTERYKPFSDQQRRELRQKYPQKYVFFHSSRQEWTIKDANDKGNDKLFKAYARFVKECCDDSLLLVVDKGRDVQNSKNLIKSLGIEDRVQWLPEQKKPQLVEIYNSVDAFFDQFTHGYYGLAALESLACATPTFIYINREQAQNVELPPIINVHNEDDIFRELSRLSQAENNFQSFQKPSREWVSAKHGANSVLDWYIDLYQNR